MPLQRATALGVMPCRIVRSQIGEALTDLRTRCELCPRCYGSVVRADTGAKRVARCLTESGCLSARVRKWSVRECQGARTDDQGLRSPTLRKVHGGSGGGVCENDGGECAL